MKFLIFILSVLIYLPLWSLETRVLEFKYSLYGGYFFADSILFSGKSGTKLGEKWLSDEHPEISSSLERIQTNRLDQSHAQVSFGADLWYFMRPDFAWTLGLTVDPYRSIKEFKFSSNLDEIARSNSVSDPGKVNGIVNGFNTFLQGLGSISKEDGFEKYNFFLVGAHVGGSVILVKRISFSAALSYYYVNEQYNDLNTLDITLHSQGTDFNLTSNLGFRIGLGWFFTDHIMLGADYRYIGLKYHLNKETSSGLFTNMLSAIWDKDASDYYDSYLEDLNGSLSGIEVYLRYFF